MTTIIDQISDNNNQNFVNKDNILEIRITNELEKEKILDRFVVDKRINTLKLTLSKKYDNKTVISPIFSSNWSKTTDTLSIQLKKKKVDDSDILKIVDVLDDNFEQVIGLNGNDGIINFSNGYDNKNTNINKNIYIRKYSANGKIPLHESIVINESSKFVSLDETKHPIFKERIQRSNCTFYPTDNIDSQNPIPYIYESEDELKYYLARASKVSFSYLFANVKRIFNKYVDAEEHYITILTGDIIYSYFQDKFPTTHYNIIVGDNGSGKNSALLLFRHLGYRVFYVVTASPANYYTFLGDIEECQGCIAEDEADDIVENNDKKRIIKTGYATGGNVPKVEFLQQPNGNNFTSNRIQNSHLTYGHKWFALEELPDSRKFKGIQDRAFIYNFVIGNPEYNIKEIIKYAGDSKYKALYDELLDMRKLLLAFRLVHYNDIIHDIETNIKHRNAELAKPLLRLFSCYKKNDPYKKAVIEEIRSALSKFIERRNSVKKNSIESKLFEVIKRLIQKKRYISSENDQNPNENLIYEFLNEDIFPEARDVMNGQPIIARPESFYSIEFGTISHKSITSIYYSKFEADSFVIGSGPDTKRGLRFSKQILDKLAAHYNMPDDITIGKVENILQETEHVISMDSPTDATDPTDIQEVDTPVKRCLDNSEYRVNQSSNSLENIGSANETKDKENGEGLSGQNKERRLKDAGSCLNSNSISDKISIDRKDVLQSTLDTPSKSVACVASVGEQLQSDILAKRQQKIKEIGRPEIPCIYCDFGDPVEFDLSLHYLEMHKQSLLELPLKGNLEKKVDHLIEETKRKMAESTEDGEE